MFHFLRQNNKLSEYLDFLIWKKTRDYFVEKYNLQNQLDKVYNIEISDFTYDGILKKIRSNLGKRTLNLIIWWPPCQTYSQIWRARVWEKINQDSRNFLYIQYVKFLKDLQPEMFVFENVPWLKTAWKWKYFSDIKKAINEVWYEFEAREQYMPDYWIPQNRKRLIIIWWRKWLKKINHYPNFSSLKKRYSYKVNDFLKDLIPINHGWWEYIMPYKWENKLLNVLWIRQSWLNFVTYHITRPIRELDRKIYKIAVQKYNNKEKLKYNELPENLQTHKNKSIFLNRFNVVSGNDYVTSTIVAHLSSDGHYYIHPDIKQNRSISIREAARLQTFPDDFQFEGSRTSIFKQIWNAVPPMFSEIVAKKLRSYFKIETTTNEKDI